MFGLLPKYRVDIRPNNLDIWNMSNISKYNFRWCMYCKILTCRTTDNFRVPQRPCQKLCEPIPTWIACWYKSSEIARSSVSASCWAAITFLIFISDLICSHRLQKKKKITSRSWLNFELHSPAANEFGYKGHQSTSSRCFWQTIINNNVEKFVLLKRDPTPQNFASDTFNIKIEMN